MSTEKLQSLIEDLLNEPSLISPHTKPSPATYFDEEPFDAAQERDDVATRADQNLHPDPNKDAAADIGLTQNDVPEAPKIHDENQSAGIVTQTLAEQAPADASADTENLAIRREQAKSLVAGLELETAIRLRWAMRDIRSKRTKLSPVSENDLAALIDLGLVEMWEDEPALTSLGVLALD